MPPAIDLRPLFAPRSIAVVGASPRGGIALTVRDNLRIMGSETRIHFVNPNHASIDGTPCHPSLDALPERPDTVILAVNPLRAARFTQEAADAGIPSIVIPGGGVVEGGEAAAEMQRTVREIAIRHGIALLGPNCMGMIDWVTNTTNYIGDVNPWLPRGHVAGLAQSGSVTDAFIHAAGVADRLQPDRVDRRRGRPRPVRLPRLLPRRPRDPRGHAVRRGLQAAGAVPRPRGPGPRDRQADPRGEGRPVAPGAGRGRRAQRQPRGRGPRDGRRPRCGGRHRVRRPRRAARAGGADRRHRASRPAALAAAGRAS